MPQNEFFSLFSSSGCFIYIYFDCAKFHGVQTPGALMGIKWDYLPICHLILITLHLFADHFDIKQQIPRHLLIIFIICV